VLEIKMLEVGRNFSEEFATARRYCNHVSSLENKSLKDSSIHYVQLFSYPKVRLEESLPDTPWIDFESNPSYMHIWQDAS
jgi:hypothetical protein